MSPTATATRGKNEQWRLALHMSIKDPQTAAQRMGCQMEEIKFEYINEERNKPADMGEGGKVVLKKRWVTELEEYQRIHSLCNTGKIPEKARN